MKQMLLISADFLEHRLEKFAKFSQIFLPSDYCVPHSLKTATEN
jgi:hypothetical protein